MTVNRRLRSSDKLINLIKTGYERFKGEAYNAGENDGILTIGHGHRDPSLKIGDTIDKTKAHELLVKDLLIAENEVKKPWIDSCRNI